MPFDNLDALERQMSDRTCAVIMEPIQGEGGILVPSRAFVEGARALCDKHRALLIFDEVQSGVGRTGELYAYMGAGVTPDILTTAKGLGGGFPIGAMLTTTEIAASFVVGTHGSTYGGNPLACAVAEEVLDIVSDPELLAGVRVKEARMRQGLEAMATRHGVFEDIRGRGLWLGCAVTQPWRGRAREFLEAAQREGLFVLVAGPDVVRLAPSLIVPDQLIDEGLQRFDRAVAALAAQAAA